MSIAAPQNEQSVLWPQRQESPSSSVPQNTPSRLDRSANYSQEGKIQVPTILQNLLQSTKEKFAGMRSNITTFAGQGGRKINGTETGQMASKYQLNELIEGEVPNPPTITMARYGESFASTTTYPGNENSNTDGLLAKSLVIQSDKTVDTPDFSLDVVETGVEGLLKNDLPKIEGATTFRQSVNRSTNSIYIQTEMAGAGVASFLVVKDKSGQISYIDLTAQDRRVDAKGNKLELNVNVVLADMKSKGLDPASVSIVTSSNIFPKFRQSEDELGRLDKNGDTHVEGLRKKMFSALFNQDSKLTVQQRITGFIESLKADASRMPNNGNYDLGISVTELTDQFIQLGEIKPNEATLADKLKKFFRR